MIQHAKTSKSSIIYIIEQKGEYSPDTTIDKRLLSKIKKVDLYYGLVLILDSRYLLRQTKNTCCKTPYVLWN